MVALYKPDLICLQETKVDFISAAFIKDALGCMYENNFVFLPASAILIAAFELHQPSFDANSITVKVSDSRRNNSWTLTGVYGPQGYLDKRMFLRELKRIKKLSANPLASDGGLQSDL
jgi:hypothetical protein